MSAAEWRCLICGALYEDGPSFTRAENERLWHLLCEALAERRSLVARFIADGSELRPGQQEDIDALAAICRRVYAMLDKDGC